jgi:hypothetical protein
MNLRNLFSPATSLSTSTTMQGAPASLSTVRFRGCKSSVYGKLNSPVCTRDYATVIRERDDNGYFTRMSLTETSKRQRPAAVQKSRTWSPKSEASKVLSRPRAFSHSLIDQSPKFSDGASSSATPTHQSPNFDQASSNTLDEGMLTESPLHLSPAPSFIRAPSSQAHQAFQLPSQASLTPTSPISSDHHMVQVVDGFSHFPDFDQMRGVRASRASTGKITEVGTEPPRSSCEHTTFSDTFAPKDGLISSAEPDASRQVETAVPIQPSVPSPTVQSTLPYSYMSFPRFPRSKARRPPLEQMTGSCISAY